MVGIGGIDNRLAVAYSNERPIGFGPGDSRGTCRLAESCIGGTNLVPSIPGAMILIRVRYCWPTIPRARCSIAVANF